MTEGYYYWAIDDHRFTPQQVYLSKIIELEGENYFICKDKKGFYQLYEPHDLYSCIEDLISYVTRYFKTLEAGE